jgi:hypothetical protein
LQIGRHGSESRMHTSHYDRSPRAAGRGQIDNSRAGQCN